MELKSANANFMALWVQTGVFPSSSSQTQHFTIPPPLKLSYAVLGYPKHYISMTDNVSAIL